MENTNTYTALHDLYWQSYHDRHLLDAWRQRHTHDNSVELRMKWFGLNDWFGQRVNASLVGDDGGVIEFSRNKGQTFTDATPAHFLLLFV